MSRPEDGSTTLSALESCERLIKMMQGQPGDCNLYNTLTTLATDTIRARREISPHEGVDLLVKTLSGLFKIHQLHCPLLNPTRQDGVTQDNMSQL